MGTMLNIFKALLPWIVVGGFLKVVWDSYGPSIKAWYEKTFNKEDKTEETQKQMLEAINSLKDEIKEMKQEKVKEE